MSILFWLCIILILIGDGLFIYASVELINHDSKESTHKIMYWGGLILQILGIIAAMYFLVRDSYRKTNTYKNSVIYKNEVKRLGTDQYNNRQKSEISAAKAKKEAMFNNPIPA